MKTEKPYLPVLIIRQELMPLYAQQKNIPIALEIDPFKSEVNKDIFEKLINGDTPFLLMFSNPRAITGITPEMTELIQLCLFSKNYIRHNDSPAVAYVQEEEITGTNKYSELLLQLQHQGWPPIVQWPLFPLLAFDEQIRKKNSTPLLLEKIDFDEDFLLHNLFSDPCNINNYIFFRTNGKQHVWELEEQFFGLCISAIGRYTLLSTYLTGYLLARNANAVLVNENRILQERLYGATHTIDIIRTKYKDDYDILFNWYQKEYEVLPPWYKKLGHIVKAITGKRTLKSLFSDDEKKEAGNRIV